jgi:hypothetical protein
MRSLDALLLAGAWFVAAACSGREFTSGGNDQNRIGDLLASRLAQ